eukprot:Rhum_TRINITY_DN8353_c0_g1::Rhum_TRINITY_DN8353_c0_g1_i1::g.27377::m.27377
MRRLLRLREAFASRFVFVVWCLYTAAVLSLVEYMDAVSATGGSVEQATRGLAFALPLSTVLHPLALLLLCSPRSVFLIPLSFVLFVTVLLSSFVEPCVSTSLYHAMRDGLGVGHGVVTCRAVPSLQPPSRYELHVDVPEAATYITLLQPRGGGSGAADGSAAAAGVDPASWLYCGVAEDLFRSAVVPPARLLLTAPVYCRCGGGGAGDGGSTSAPLQATGLSAAYVLRATGGGVGAGATPSALGWPVWRPTSPAGGSADTSVLLSNLYATYTVRRFAATVALYNDRTAFEGMRIPSSWVVWGPLNNQYGKQEVAFAGTPAAAEGEAAADGERTAFHDRSAAVRYVELHEKGRTVFRVVTACGWMLGTLSLWVWGTRVGIWNAHDGGRELEEALARHAADAARAAADLDAAAASESAEVADGGGTAGAAATGAGVYVVLSDTASSATAASVSAAVPSAGALCSRAAAAAEGAVLLAGHGVVPLAVYAAVGMFEVSSVAEVRFWVGVTLCDAALLAAAVLVAVDCMLVA